MSNEWDEYAPGWDEDPVARAYAGAAFGSLSEVLEESRIELPRSHVLDFGCGTGLLTELLVKSGALIDAVDTSTAMLEVLDAKIQKQGWDTVRTSAALPTANTAYDLVVCSSVLSFVEDYPACVAELVTRLVPGGLFVQWDWERTDGEEHGLTREEIRAALTAANLVDVAVDTAFEVGIEGHIMSPLIGHGQVPSKGG